MEWIALYLYVMGAIALCPGYLAHASTEEFVLAAMWPIVIPVGCALIAADALISVVEDRG